MTAHLELKYNCDSGCLPNGTCKGHVATLDYHGDDKGFTFNNGRGERDSSKFFESNEWYALKELIDKIDEWSA